MWIRLAVALVAAGFVLVVGVASFRYGVMSENARWLRISAEAGAKYAEAVAKQQARVDQLQQDLDAERRRFKVKREEVIRVISTDPPSVEWGSVRIPDRVRDSLRGAAMPADPGGVDGAVSVDGAEARD
jgi:hypothetical protein